MASPCTMSRPTDPLAGVPPCRLPRLTPLRSCLATGEILPHALHKQRKGIIQGKWILLKPSNKWGEHREFEMLFRDRMWAGQLLTRLLKTKAR
jgi:hypothetical protein